jgi:uncharacterized protein
MTFEKGNRTLQLTCHTRRATAPREHTTPTPRPHLLKLHWSTVTPLNEFVVKIASNCNLRCTYCYEYNAGDESWRKHSKVMSQATAVQLARRIREHAEKHAVHHVAIGLHGGEPLMVGASHLDALASIFRHYLSSFNTHISVQTNATLITERICDVIRRHDVKLSMSIDGGRGANSRRVDLRNRPSFDAATRGIEFAKKTM